MIWFILTAAISFLLGNIAMYQFMRGELDDAWGQVNRTWREKESWRLKYDELKGRKKR